MDKHLVKAISFRFTDESVPLKLNYIAKLHKRNRNKEVEWALAQYIEQFEKEYGKIDI